MFYKEVTDLNIISVIFCKLNEEKMRKRTISEPTEQENKTTCKFPFIYVKKIMLTINDKAK